MLISSMSFPAEMISHRGGFRLAKRPKRLHPAIPAPAGASTRPPLDAFSGRSRSARNDIPGLCGGAAADPSGSRVDRHAFGQAGGGKLHWLFAGGGNAEADRLARTHAKYGGASKARLSRSIRGEYFFAVYPSVIDVVPKCVCREGGRCTFRGSESNGSLYQQRRTEKWQASLHGACGSRPRGAPVRFLVNDLQFATSDPTERHLVSSVILSSGEIHTSTCDKGPLARVCRELVRYAR